MSDTTFVPGAVIASTWLNDVNDVVYGPTSPAGTFRAQLVASSGSSLVGHIASGTGAVATTTQAKLRERISVKDFGATGDGVTNDTAAIQAAITAAGAGKALYFPAGTYILTATLNALSNQSFEGDGPNNTILRRDTDYGDTIAFAAAGACSIRNMWFRHSNLPDPADVTLANKVTSASAHVRLTGGQGVVIEDCWFWRMPVQVEIADGSLIKINRCHMQGVWDTAYVAMQEGRASVRIGNVAYSQLISITTCYFGGSASVARNVTYTSSDSGASIYSIAEDRGNLYGIEVIRCEDLLIDGCYFGGNAETSLQVNPAASAVSLNHRILGNFFDGAGTNGAQIKYTTQSNGTYSTDVSIANNVFVGALLTFQGIVVINGLGTQPTLTGFNITGNVLQAMVGSAMLFYNAQGGVVANNTIGSYNGRNTSAGGDVTFSAGAYIGADSRNILFNGNIVGGATNSFGSPSFCYLAIVLTAAHGTIVEKNTVVIGSGLTGTLNGKIDKRLIQFTAAGNYTILGNEDVVVVNKTVGGATQVNLPALVPVGWAVTVKDGKGDAAANPIALIGTIDGAVNLTMNVNYQVKTVVWTGNEWNVIGS